MARPKNPELDKAEEQIKAFENSIQDLTLDRMNEAKKEDLEPQTKLSQKELDRSREIYLKPIRTISCSPKDKFNEKFREKYEFDKEYVKFIAEHKEIIGEEIEIWTRPYGGMPAEFWKIPTNKPIWAPRYVAEQIKKCTYHRLKMEQTTNSSDGMGMYYGTMVSDTTVQRLDAIPVSTRKSVFMGA